MLTALLLISAPLAALPECAALERCCRAWQSVSRENAAACLDTARSAVSLGVSEPCVSAIPAYGSPGAPAVCRELALRRPSPSKAAGLATCIGSSEGRVDKTCIGRPRSKSVLRVVKRGVSGALKDGTDTLAEALPAASDCYDASLAGNVAQSGVIALEARVGPSGTVVLVSSTQEGLTDDSLVRCLEGALEGVRFGHVQGAQATARLTLQLLPPALTQRPGEAATQLCSIATALAKTGRPSGREVATSFHEARVDGRYMRLLDSMISVPKNKRYAAWTLGLVALGEPRDSAECKAMQVVLEQ